MMNHKKSEWASLKLPESKADPYKVYKVSLESRTLPVLIYEGNRVKTSNVSCSVGPVYMSPSKNLLSCLKPFIMILISSKIVRE
jgi:hypothetical protein